jgi:N-acetylgalactosamine kinase
MAVQRRSEGRVVVHDVERDRFPTRSFIIEDELPRSKVSDWDAWSRAENEKMRAAGIMGDWANYVKAAVLFLQNDYRRQDGSYIKRLSGMNMVIGGNIPMAAGISSSSALVVASAEAALWASSIEMSPGELVDATGLGEWYVGTRGGRGDHAAIKLSRRGYISHIGFFPLRIDYVPFPEDYRVVILNSGVEAKKSAGARNVFNNRVVAYEIGLMYIRRNYPELSPKLKYLRDVNSDNLRVSEDRIYEILLSLPERVGRSDLALELPDYRDQLARLYATHDEPEEGYRVRGVCLYGLAECQRSKMVAKHLKDGNMAAFGELMNLGHEGDRVTHLKGGRRLGKDKRITDDMMESLISESRSSDPRRAEGARLYRQAGAYDVSCPETDELVDIAREVPGVLGARLIGAGLGGCVGTLVKRSSVWDLTEAALEKYYKPRGLPPGVEVCWPIAGSGAIDL